MLLAQQHQLGSFPVFTAEQNLRRCQAETFHRFLDQFPGMRKCADNIRTAMTKILDVALLVGGMMAANAMAPGLGFLLVVGLFALNQTAKHPLVTMAVGPVGAIFVGVLINILYVAGLYLPVAAK